MTPLEKKIEEVLRLLRGGLNSEIDQDIEAAKSALLQLLTETVQEALPEKSAYKRQEVQVPEGFIPALQREEDAKVGYSSGYNTAIDQMTANLNRILGGDK